MNRRHFLALASGLLVPEPVRAYSFVGGWKRYVLEYDFAVSQDCTMYSVVYWFPDGWKTFREGKLEPAPSPNWKELRASL